MKLKHLSQSVMLMGVAVGAFSSTALASGYHFGSQSVSAQGTAFANGAEAADASTIFYNPAGMSRLTGDNFSGGLTLVVPDSSYTDKGSKTNESASTGGGSTSGYAPDYVVAPSFYATHQINDKWTAGLGVFVPFGAELNYGQTWAGRYSLESIKLETLNFNPSVSYKLDDHHAFGFGVSAQYMKAYLSKAVDLSVVGGSDGQASLSADGWGFGFNLGYMYQLDDATRFGVAYRSNIRQKLDGQAYWDLRGAGSFVSIIQNNFHHVNSDGTVTVDTPESISVNGFHKLNDKVDLMTDLTWTRHSRMDQIDIKFSQPGEGDLVIKQGWRDTFKLSLGANYHYSDNLLLRTGVAWDQSPVKNADETHPALPDSDRYWLSFGANYKLSKQSSIDFAYSYVFFKNANINYTDGCSPTSTTCTGNGETTTGSYKTNLQFLGLQYNYSF
ncbi:transporter [Aquitalea palustris]|uniref:Transporter n=1 Tax=Aquitalea palustris TaxID=2480983 RepID=A0A454JDA8_9NEIS|nr:OmpP1/FadL family transporter [Aquitalea palustris]RMC91392.1 transporter [Aquitalea palustris]